MSFGFYRFIPVTPDDGAAGRSWFAGLGAAITLSGILLSLHLLMASVVTTFVIAMVMLAGGALQFIHAAGLRRLDGAPLWISSAVLYLLAALAALIEPLFSSDALLLALAGCLGLSGLFRVMIAAMTAAASGGWSLLSGSGSILAASIVAMGWPDNSLWRLGVVIAGDLLCQGLTMIALAILMKPGPLGPGALRD